MLELKGIKKDYGAGENIVHALKGVTLSFRKSEFVSILGASGCGKTTMLNIIGGLDRYTEGDLVINGRSTKSFRDADWDIYRNHRVGFIFQSYNLIPHQTVLGNVELALTIAGISKAERIERAKRALDKVGLSDQYNKRPNQLSGGQSQRVAIARALVNDPEILLADEPTGALDTTTSVQIMELIREIAKEQLVIMVTHNPELAEKYSSRIIHLSDGELVSDSNPYQPTKEDQDAAMEQAAAEDAPEPGKKKKTKTKMSLFTAFKLSLHNLLTKKRRTMMTSIAGSIGIIGISLVLAVSYGVQVFIMNMQNDMLSGNPITVSESALDLTALMQSGDIDYDQVEWQDGKINVDSTISNLVKRSESMSNIMQTNEVTQDYIDYVKSLPESQVSAIMLDYGLNLNSNLYTEFRSPKPGGGGESAEMMSFTAIKAIYEAILIHSKEYAQYAAFISGLEDPFKQLPVERDYILGNNEKGVEGQYNLVNTPGFESKYATEANEVMLVLRKNHWLSDLLLAQLGFYSQNEFMNMVARAVDKPDQQGALPYNPDLDKYHFEYSDIIGHEFIYYPNSVAFEQVVTPYRSESATPLIDDSIFHHRPYESDFSQEEKDKGIRLKVVGILEPKEDLSYGTLNAGFFYTEALRDRIFEFESEGYSDIVKYMIKNGSFSSSYQKDQKLPGQTEKQDVLEGVTFRYKYVYPYTGENDENVAYSAVGASNPFLGLASTFGGAAVSGTEGFDSAGLEMVIAGLSAKTLGLRDLSGRTVERAALATDTILTQLKEENISAAKAQAVLLAGVDAAQKQMTDAQKQMTDAQNALYDLLATGQMAQLPDAITNYGIASYNVDTQRELLKDEWKKVNDCFTKHDFDGTHHTFEAEIDLSVQGQKTVKLVFDRLGGLQSYTTTAETDAEIYIAAAVLYLNAASAADPVYSQLTTSPIVDTKLIANSISIYPVDFDQKQLVLAHLDAWNGDGAVTITYADGTTKTVERADRANITYSDFLSIVFEMIGMFINIITIALICFTALALVVSTVMIAIITYVSVVERTKEIGVIRSLGGRKKDVSHLFNAETFIIGMVSGLIGIIFTFLASWIINMIVNAFQPGLGAIALFPWFYALLMLGVSVGLTLISGLIPSRSAAKKDPVVALRSE